MQYIPNQPEEGADDEFYAVPTFDVAGPHSPDHPFCDDMSCPCHEDSELVADLAQYVDDGLATASDADRIFRGRQI